jgi:NAD(P)-dependent dehydrogenase (short-subunit alcohol dehydrogenase family)
MSNHDAPVAVVTGAARGIGLALCRQLLADGYVVVAAPRKPASEGLVELAGEYPDRLREIPTDVADESSVANAAREIGEWVERVDLLINNAGVYPRDGGGVESLDAESLLRGFEVNTVGPLRVIRHLLPLLRRGRGRRLIQITSLMGSLADNTSGGSYAYRMSKTALNMAVRNLAHELGSDGFIALAIHPGWVRTAMGGTVAPLELEPAATEILRIALEAGPEDNGGFKGPGGKDLPF